MSHRYSHPFVIISILILILLSISVLFFRTKTTARTTDSTTSSSIVDNNISTNNDDHHNYDDDDVSLIPPSRKALKVQKDIDQAIRIISQQSTEETKTNNNVIISLPGGTIQFNDAAFIIRNAHNITIRGVGGQKNNDDTNNGTVLLFRPGYGVHIENSSNCIIESIRIDYHPKPYVYGRVVSKKKKKKKTTISSSSSSLMVVKLDPESLSFETLVTKYKPHDIWPPVVGLDRVTGEFKQLIGKWGEPPLFFHYNPNQQQQQQHHRHYDYYYYYYYYYRDDDDEEEATREQQQQQQQQQQRRRQGQLRRRNERYYILKGDNHNLQIDDSFVAATRVGFTMALSYTSNITLRGITINSAGNMAITEFLGRGRNRYDDISIGGGGGDGDGVSSSAGAGGGGVNNNNVVAPAAVSSNADGFHSSGMRYGPILSNIRMNNLLDDYFNIHNTFQIVAKMEEKKEDDVYDDDDDHHQDDDERDDKEGSNNNKIVVVLVGDYQYLSSSSSSDNNNNNNTLYGTQQTLSQVVPGELVSFYRINQLMFPQALATGRVIKIERVTPNDHHHLSPSEIETLLNQTHSTASKMANVTPYPCSSCKPGLNTYTTAQLWRITLQLLMMNNSTTTNNNNNNKNNNTAEEELETPTSLLPQDDDDVNITLSFLNADNISNTGAVIEGCTFKGTIANLGRFKSSGGKILQNTWLLPPQQQQQSRHYYFETNNNLEIEPLQNWMEGMLGIRNVLIQDNIFHGVPHHDDGHNNKPINPIHTNGAVNVRQVNNSFLPSIH